MPSRQLTPQVPPVPGAWRPDSQRKDSGVGFWFKNHPDGSRYSAPGVLLAAVAHEALTRCQPSGLEPYHPHFSEETEAYTASTRQTWAVTPGGLASECGLGAGDHVPLSSPSSTQKARPSLTPFPPLMATRSQETGMSPSPTPTLEQPEEEPVHLF